MGHFETLGGSRLTKEVLCLRSSEHAHITENIVFTIDLHYISWFLPGKSADTKRPKSPIAELSMFPAKQNRSGFSEISH